MAKLKRDLIAIVADLHVVLKRKSADIIEAGKLLCEAKAQVEHGEWLPWVEREFSLSERSAQKYMRAYEWTNKSAPGADLGNLSPSLIYELSNKSGWYAKAPEVVAAILKEATDKRVGSDRGYEILMATIAPSEPENKPEPEAEPEPNPESDTETSAEARKALHAEQAAAQPEPDAGRWSEQSGEEAAEGEAAAEAAEDSKNTLSIFKRQCEALLPDMNAEDLAEAIRYANEIASRSSAGAAMARAA